MITKLYRKILDIFSKAGEQGEYSAGYLQNKVREKALLWCQSLNGKLLEIGCGEGLFLQRLKESSFELFGLDNSKERTLAAERRLGSAVKLYEADATLLPFENDYFDCIVCVNVIFNLPSKEVVEKTLSEIHRTLKKGGKVIFDFRNRKNILLFVKYSLAPLYDATVRKLPLMMYSLEEMRNLLGKYNFRITKTEKIGFSAPVIMLKAEK
ncbi:class I SAM-dependent methyltransferase [Candidatus Margulisiibacteriota bacterium]